MTAIVSPISQQQSRTTPREAEAQPVGSISRRAVYAGRALSGFAVLFLAFDASLKVFELLPATDASRSLGWDASLMFPIGLIEVAFLVAYLVPRTSVLGAILWSAYLGGAVATHMRVGSPLFSHTLFPIYVAAFLWAGLWLRDRRVRALIGPPPRD